MIRSESPTVFIYDTDDKSCEINLSTKRLEVWIFELSKTDTNPGMKMCR